jgi:hypothetical protein
MMEARWPYNICLFSIASDQNWLFQWQFYNQELLLPNQIDSIGDISYFENALVSQN